MIRSTTTPHGRRSPCRGSVSSPPPRSHRRTERCRLPVYPWRIFVGPSFLPARPLLATPLTSGTGVTANTPVAACEKPAIDVDRLTGDEGPGLGSKQLE